MGRTTTITRARRRRRPVPQRCFRPRLSYLITGIMGAIFFPTVGVVSTVSACLNLDGSFASPVLAAVTFAAFWSGFTLLSVWALAAYFRERLVLGKSRIVRRGVFRLRTLAVGDVQEVRWHTRPRGGGITARTRSEKVTISLENFTWGNAWAIVRFFRDQLPRPIQHNWRDFGERFRGWGCG
jgi:hypothetical protein